MLKIQHPASITRDREKKVNQWETVRTYKYANGVECQILIGFLPHGHVQSVVSANRTLSVSLQEKDALLSFSDEAAPLVDFLNGDRPTSEGANTLVLDPCLFLPTLGVAVVHDGEEKPGDNEVVEFSDGTVVKIHGHGHHAHLETTKDGKPVKAFFNGKENKLYVFGPLEA